MYLNDAGYEWDAEEELRSPNSPPSAPAPPPSGGGYTINNPPPAGSAPPGTQWMLNPTTGQFEPIPIGTLPPWGARVDQPGTPPPVVSPTPKIEPPPTTYGGGGYGGGYGVGFGGGSGGMGGYDPSGFEWPQFQGPSPFSFESFKAPDFSDIFKDPSYTGRRDEGLRAIEHGAAAKGLTRLPQTLKSLGAWNQDFASREYGNIFDRSANTWSMNRGNASDAWQKNYGQAKDTFDFNQFQPAKLTFDDLYRRWKSELDSTTSIATAGMD